ncbi:hypothetical protein Pcinc_022989 [Petrolisthes cinctipes]|uniref:Uncharacterized protein n=1 Tax=Petrolisthes cinctipes TaxID=88211 RepID=A0AAE1FD53_PETCI|nr:hypothetical protein Pcinc_022989 [Petrolisthes cinctipes]
MRVERKCEHVLVWNPGDFYPPSFTPPPHPYTNHLTTFSTVYQSPHHHLTPSSITPPPPPPHPFTNHPTTTNHLIPSPTTPPPPPPHPFTNHPTTTTTSPFHQPPHHHHHLTPSPTTSPLIYIAMTWEMNNTHHVDLIKSWPGFQIFISTCKIFCVRGSFVCMKG